MSRQTQIGSGRRHGVALVMVMVLIVLLSLGAYAFTDLMLAQQAGSQTTGRRVQARAAVASGVDYLKDYLSQDPLTQLENGGHYDNPNYFADVVVDPESNLRFSIISITEDVYGEPSGIRNGLYDLGARINVNELVNSSAYQAARADGSGGEEGPADEDDQGDGGQGGGGGDDGGGGGAEGNEDGGDGGGGRGGDGGDDGGGGGDDGGGSGSGNAGGDAGGGQSGSGSSSSGGTGEEEADTGEPADPARDALMAVPGMTEDIADSILDWIDEDDEPRPFGAETAYYSYDGYEPRNGPLTSLDELLLVKGVTPELLFGADRNHNGLVDEAEQGQASALQSDISSMSRGWSAFLTVRSMDAPLQNEPIDLNQEDLEVMYDEILTVEGMNQDIATYIAAYRQSGPYTPPQPSQDDEDGGEQGGDGDQGGENQEPPEPEQINGRSVDLTQAGSQTITSVLDLVGSMTQAKFEGDEPTLVESPFGTDPSELANVLPDLMANFTTGEEAAAGRINLNQCSQVTLSSVPGMSEELVQSILGQQDPSGMSTDPNLQYPTWPLAYGLTTVEEMKGLLPLLSTTGGVYTAQIVATSDLPGGFARAEVVIDASGDTPQIVSLRDLTHLGPGFTTPAN